MPTHILKRLIQSAVPGIRHNICNVTYLSSNKCIICLLYAGVNMPVFISSRVIMEEFSNNLAVIMAERGLNQPELARLSGVDQSLISRYLRNDQRARLPRLKNLVALAKALDCTLEDLIGVKKTDRLETELQDNSPSRDQIALWEAYNKLPEGHWLRVMIEQELLDQNES